MKNWREFITETDSRMYGDDSVLKPTKGKPKPPCKGKDCEKKPKPFMGYEETIHEGKRDGDVWQTDGGWAAQARGVVDYFDSRESAEAYAKGYSSQRRGAFTRTGGQSRETKAKMSEPRRGGRMLGGEIQ